MATRLLSQLIVAGLLASVFPAVTLIPVAEAMDENELKVSLFSSVAEPRAATEKIPSELKKFRKSLLNISNRFQFLKEQKSTLKQSKVTIVTLPQKLGEAKISWDGRSATVEVVQKKKRLYKIKVSRFPAFLVDDSLKVGGNRVVLILDRDL